MEKRLLKVLSFVIAGVVFFGACKKDRKASDNTEVSGATKSGTRADLTKDSIFLYAKEVYYWNTTLPGYAAFNPRGFQSSSDELANYNQELYKLTQYSTNPATGKPYEYVANSAEPKYSFIDDGAVSDELSGEGGDYGFSAKADANGNVRVSYVYAGSPADAQGLKRGFQITRVNGTAVNLASQTSVDAINDGIFGTNPSVTLAGIDGSGTTKTLVINRGFYNLNPILYSSIYSVGAKKVGYFVLSSFTGNVNTQLAALFNDFATKGVSEVIVDLRYNGGGLVSTSAFIANYLVPASQNNKVMFTYYFNSYLQNLTATQRKASVLINQPLLDEDGKLQLSGNALNGKFYTYADVGYQPTDEQGNVEHFNKTGSLNLSRVYFIVSGGTASASELTINNLKPTLDVKLIGSTTYGKPVGFFAIHIDKVDMYTPEFETKNQNNEGGYYTGMTVDQTAVDDIGHDFGDPNEAELQYALNYAGTGNFTTPAVVTLAGTKKTVLLSKAASKASISAAEQDALQQKLNPGKFSGMIYDGPNLRH